MKWNQPTYSIRSDYFSVGRIASIRNKKRRNIRHKQAMRDQWPIMSISVRADDRSLKEAMDRCQRALERAFDIAIVSSPESALFSPRPPRRSS